MTTEYHDNTEEDSFWRTESRNVTFSKVSRSRSWLFPALTATVILALVIALGAINTTTSNRLWSLETSVSNMTHTLNAAQQLSKDAGKDVHRLKFAVENNKDQLTSVAEALKQLASLDTVIRSVQSLKCSVERLINNSSDVDGCCPLEWDTFGGSCYFYSKMSLTWHRARDWCNSHDSHLLILSSDKEWDYVVQHAHGGFYWIGLTDEDGEWEWVNKTPYVIDRRRWKPGQPDSWTHHGLGPGDEDCAHLHHDGRLNDLHCNSRMNFICQRHTGIKI
ncbi:C-type lectin domain family 10 member A-like [Cynoglossus semilaevis]|uniref:C-type lectin domain family 10 member A-like n=1 Tax=Cynoglossus semilaevis TaxID=244447 RepID=A0A3P8UY96_CYNSE|nr:C-type lectin domain family 10 member A-like [Cynoglossus semilaevis]